MEQRPLENEMYRVMDAINRSGIPINFKGALVLHAFLYENGFENAAVRPTRDIDGNWISDVPPTAEQMVDSLQQVLDENHIELKVKLFRMYGENRSAGFDFCDSSSEDVIFSMDMDVNRPEAGIRLYEVQNFKFKGIVVEQILADKISAVSSDKVFRRVKDVIDLYYLSKCFEMNPTAVRTVLDQTGRSLASFDGFLHRKQELQQAYSKFRFAGNAEKPDFNLVYEDVMQYISEFL